MSQSLTVWLFVWLSCQTTASTVLMPPPLRLTGSLIWTSKSTIAGLAPQACLAAQPHMPLWVYTEAWRCLLFILRAPALTKHGLVANVVCSFQLFWHLIWWGWFDKRHYQVFWMLSRVWGYLPPMKARWRAVARMVNVKRYGLKRGRFPDHVWIWVTVLWCGGLNRRI